MDGKAFNYTLFDSFGRFVIMIKYRQFIFTLLLVIGFINSINAQHYFFIECDGQQPFYLKKADSIYSSSSNGFLIVPKNYDDKVSFTIGFPRNQYPEISFQLDDMSKDRGFQLKHFEGKGWGLFDRTTFEVNMSIQDLSLTAKVSEANQSGKSNEFANVLSEITDDKSLLEKAKTPERTSISADSIGKTLIIEPSVVLKKNENDTNLVRNSTAISIEPPPSDTIMNTGLTLKFIDKSTNGKPDTIDLQIDIVDTEKVSIKNSLPETASNKEILSPGELSKSKADISDTIVKDSISTDESSKTVIDSISSIDSSIYITSVSTCVLLPADQNDIKSMQKKLLGFIKPEAQLNYADKMYHSKCFTTKQSMELSWFFLDEEVRLNFFTLIYPLIADRENFGTLEVGFVEEKNIKAFRELLLNK